MEITRFEKSTENQFVIEREQNGKTALTDQTDLHSKK